LNNTQIQKIKNLLSPNPILSTEQSFFDPEDENYHQQENNKSGISDINGYKHRWEGLLGTHTTEVKPTLTSINRYSHDDDMGEGEYHPKAGKMISNKSQGVVSDDGPIRLKVSGGKHTSEESKKWKTSTNKRP
jgi:hypothetical protein